MVQRGRGDKGSLLQSVCMPSLGRVTRIIMRLALASRAASLYSAAAIAFLLLGRGGSPASRPAGVLLSSAPLSSAFSTCHRSSSHGALVALIYSPLVDELVSCRGHSETGHWIQPRRDSSGRRLFTESDGGSGEEARGGTNRLASHSGSLPRVFFGLTAAEAGTRQAWRTEAGWQKAAHQWQTRAAPYGVSVHRRESGGGGDCLYHSIASCLEELRHKYSVFGSLTMKDIRTAAADGFVGYPLSTTAEKKPWPTWDAKAFMERLSVLSVLEDEQWFDLWSPTTILSSDQYRNTGHIIMDTSTPQGKAEAVHYELSRPGAVHWGTGFDVGAIEDGLNVGIIILSDDTGRMYPRAARTDVKRPYYILLYYYSDTHFQQAGIGRRNELSGEIEIASAFRADEVPDFLLDVHSQDSRHPLYPVLESSEEGL
ncbi:transmembrane protein [Cystoisospora suis]|uniref:Transmembrane protein n=1 Tax=Cystoisospora suis TaxID=483139 RepID=A0A2C6LB56_9APIC|nr:transmembrane protein [Cystoisospora suis]